MAVRYRCIAVASAELLIDAICRTLQRTVYYGNVVISLLVQFSQDQVHHCGLNATRCAGPFSVHGDAASGVFKQDIESRQGGREP